MATAADAKNDQKTHLENHTFTQMLAFSADEYTPYTYVSGFLSHALPQKMMVIAEDAEWFI